MLNWREPDDDFGASLRRAFESALENRTVPPRAVQKFEVLLDDLYRHYDQAKVDRLGMMGFELFEVLETKYADTSPTVLHFVERLHEVWGSPDPSGVTANVGDMLLWARELVKEGPSQDVQQPPDA